LIPQLKRLKKQKNKDDGDAPDGSAESSAVSSSATGTSDKFNYGADSSALRDSTRDSTGQLRGKKTVSFGAEASGLKGSGGVGDGTPFGGVGYGGAAYGGVGYGGVSGADGGGQARGRPTATGNPGASRKRKQRAAKMGRLKLRGVWMGIVYRVGIE
jgi:hypothetical protein